MNNNPIQEFLKNFFDSLVLLQQSQSLIEAALKGSITNFKKLKDQNKFIFYNALIIGDWTGPNDNGWKINYPTGSERVIRKEDFAFEINRLVSYECCYLFSQAFERLQSLLKDFIAYILSTDENFCNEQGFKANQAFHLYRSMPFKRDEILRLVKRIFTEPYKKPSVIIHFKELWVVLATTRDAIVHSNNIIKSKETTKWTKMHFERLDYLFPKIVYGTDKSIEVVADRNDFSRAVIKIAEFGFQVFKQISIKHNYEWKILKNYGLIPSEERKKSHI